MAYTMKRGRKRNKISAHTLRFWAKKVCFLLFKKMKIV